MERELEWWEVEEREIHRLIQGIQEEFQKAIKPYVDRLVMLQTFHPIRVTLTPDSYPCDGTPASIIAAVQRAMGEK